MPFDFSLVSAPFRMQPGLRRIAPGTGQLTPNTPGARHLREKLAVLAADPRRALLAVPGFDAAPALHALALEAAGAAPSAFEFTGPADCAAPRLGWSVRAGKPAGSGDPAIGALLAGLEPGRRAPALLSLAFAEDFAVIDGDSAIVPWLAVCLPSRWAPEEKIGRHFAAIHAPVADGEALRAAGEHLARLVTGGERWERFVWTISADGALAQHPTRERTRWPADAAADALAAAAWWRSEHQTFLPVPGTRQAVFTIHVDSTPLVRAVATAEAAARVRAALASMSPSVLAYRGLDKARDRLLDWLARRAGAAAAA